MKHYPSLLHQNQIRLRESRQRLGKTLIWFMTPPNPTSINHPAKRECNINAAALPWIICEHFVIHIIFRLQVHNKKKACREFRRMSVTESESRRQHHGVGNGLHTSCVSRYLFKDEEHFMKMGFSRMFNKLWPNFDESGKHPWHLFFW